MRFSSNIISRTSLTRAAAILFVCLVSALAADVGMLAGEVKYHGSGISGALVKVYHISGQEAKAVNVTRTSGSGSFSFSNLAAGEYILIISQAPETLFQGKVTIEAGKSVVKQIELSSDAVDTKPVPPIRIQAPIAVAYGEALGLVVLTKSGSVLSIDTNRRTVRQLFECYSSVDFSCGRVGSRDVIVISRDVSSATSGRVVTVFQQGDEKPLSQSVLAAGRFGGVAIDESRAFLSNPVDHQVYSFRIVGNRLRDTKQLVSIPESKSLDAMAPDAAGHKLFVADGDAGNIYVIDLITARHSVFATGLNQAKALAVDSRRRRLCVAAGKRIIAIQLDDGKSRTIIKDNLKSASGVAFDAGGQMWVSDFGLNVLIGPM